MLTAAREFCLGKRPSHSDSARSLIETASDLGQSAKLPRSRPGRLPVEDQIQRGWIELARVGEGLRERRKQVRLGVVVGDRIERGGQAVLIGHFSPAIGRRYV
jgi:hypothetical protein